MHFHLSMFVRARWYGALLCLFGGAQLRAEVELPSVFSDHMVLQRDQSTALWGWADEGEKLTVHWGPSSVSLRADDKGKWSVRLDSRPAGGPFELRIEGKTNSIHSPIEIVGSAQYRDGRDDGHWKHQRHSSKE